MNAQALFMEYISAFLRNTITHASDATTTLDTCGIPKGEKTQRCSANVAKSTQRPWLSAHAYARSRLHIQKLAEKDQGSLFFTLMASGILHWATCVGVREHQRCPELPQLPISFILPGFTSQGRLVLSLWGLMMRWRTTQRMQEDHVLFCHNFNTVPSQKM